jgi:hypothetical protein
MRIEIETLKELKKKKISREQLKNQKPKKGKPLD